MSDGEQTPSTFVEACNAGVALLDEIDDYVDRWHESDSVAPLATYLGMSADEYALWVEQPDALGFIVAAHKMSIPVAKLMEVEKSASYAAAARAGSREDAERILAWLKGTGRI